ncbi:MAG TPA: rhodanese-like domain-containing protein [Burkholderiales bacterium]|nr:rhodanese-like domain-containing protein [Burkholderiales bacterium]
MREISAPELAAWLADASREKPQLVDVREAWEFERARIDGAQLVPMREVAGRLAEINPAKPVVAICHHGGRSMQIALFLEKAGYNNVHNLVGGVDAWSRSVDPAVPIY